MDLANKELVSRDEKIKHLEGRVERVGANVNRLNRRLKLRKEPRDEKVAEQRAEIDRLTLEVAQLPVVQAELEREKEQSKRAKEDAAAALRKCQDELSEKDTTLTARLEMTSREWKAAKSECEELSAFKAKHLSCKSDISTLKANIKVKEIRVAELEKQTEEQATEIADLNETNATQLLRIIELGENNDQLSMRFDIEADEFADKESKAAAIKSELEQQKSRQDKRIRELTADKGKLQAELRQVKSELERSRQESRDMAAELKDVRARRDKDSQTHSDNVDELNRLKRDLESKESECGTLDTHLQQARAAHADSDTELAGLRSEADDLEAALEKLTKDKADVHTRLEKADNQFSELKLDRDQLKEELETAKESEKSAEDSLTTAEVQLREADATVASLGPQIVTIQGSSPRPSPKSTSRGLGKASSSKRLRGIKVLSSMLKQPCAETCTQSTTKV